VGTSTIHLHTKSHLPPPAVCHFSPLTRQQAHVLSLCILQQHFTTLIMSNVSRSIISHLLTRYSCLTHPRDTILLLLVAAGNYLGRGVSSSGTVSKSNFVKYGQMFDRDGGTDTCTDSIAHLSLHLSREIMTLTEPGTATRQVITTAVLLCFNP
jgi:hypothetical protein